MSNDREFDLLVEEAQQLLRQNAATAEEMDRMAVLLRQVYRAGARAQLDHAYRRQVDPVDRVRWLAERGFGADLKALVAEVEDAREKTAALSGTYGVTDSEISSMLAEGFHTAFRKAVDSPFAAVIHKLIRDMEDGEYAAIIDFTADPLVSRLREAEKTYNSSLIGKESS